MPCEPGRRTKMMSSTPAATASSTRCWMMGRSTSGISSLGSTLVAGRNRVPNPATANTAFLMVIAFSPHRRTKDQGRRTKDVAFVRLRNFVLCTSDFVLFERDPPMRLLAVRVKRASEPPRSRGHLALLLLLAAATAAAADAPKMKWLKAKAHVVPKETATEGEGYFSIIEGKNGRLYVGTHANGVNSWLVEFDPVAQKMAVVVDAHKAIGKDLKGFASQAKIHTRNNVGASGKVYFGTKQGYPSKDEKYTDYPGGYPMAYDPKTGQTTVYPIPVPHHGINSITPDESRGVAFVSTCSDGRPGPRESSHLLVLDLKTHKYRDLVDAEHPFGFIVLDHLGRAYHPVRGGDIVRYDPRSGKLERLKQTIDGKLPTAESHLADDSPHPINWDVSPDGKTLYALPMSTNLV